MITTDNGGAFHITGTSSLIQEVSAEGESKSVAFTGNSGAIYNASGTAWSLDNAAFTGNSAPIGTAPSATQARGQHHPEQRHLRRRDRG